mmetsp:Transcript_13938/g.29244  ORF Transcript_13938/g.29244 Transcript_13938/m.29244 type:complete len:88 (-) Transcript_13938:127-390(-)
MEVMKWRYLLLYGAGNSSVLFVLRCNGTMFLKIDCYAICFLTLLFPNYMSMPTTDPGGVARMQQWRQDKLVHDAYCKEKRRKDQPAQ